jgi:hypothetical protein
MIAKRIESPIMRTQLFLTALLASLLTACGGGGGGGSTPVVPPTPDTVLTIVPSPTMTWATSSDSTLNVTVNNADGSAANGAAVRIFSLTRSGPDGSALAAPVALSLLNSAPTSASGLATLPMRLAATQSEVLVVATLGDTKAQGAVSMSGTPTLVLTLAP